MTNRISRIYPKNLDDIVEIIVNGPYSTIYQLVYRPQDNTVWADVITTNGEFPAYENENIDVFILRYINGQNGDDSTNYPIWNDIRRDIDKIDEELVDENPDIAQSEYF